jgi:hypothetical protein
MTSILLYFQDDSSLGLDNTYVFFLIVLGGVISALGIAFVEKCGIGKRERKGARDNQTLKKNFGIPVLR